jgi:DNA topoisomerase VI subunit A
MKTDYQKIVEILEDVWYTATRVAPSNDLQRELTITMKATEIQIILHERGVEMVNGDFQEG